MTNMDKIRHWSEEEAREFSKHIAEIDARIRDALTREGISYP